MSILDLDKKLSKNFILNEFIISQVAQRIEIDNTPDYGIIKNLEQLCINVLQPLREQVGVPVFISSGYRSPALNAYIGGSSTSQHKEGKAADLYHPEYNKIFFDIIKNYLPFDQLIWELGDDEYPAWVHVSYNGDNNRKEVLKAYKNRYGIRYDFF